jgi:hypothetical protein
MPGMRITTLPTHVLSCIVGHLQQDAWQRHQRLSDVAALRSVCHLLRDAVDHIVTHAAVHAYVDIAQLRRCTGDTDWTSYRTTFWGSLSLICRRYPSWLWASDAIMQYQQDQDAVRSPVAGLHTVKLQQLHPDAAGSTLEALSALHNLRSLDMP